MQEQLAWGEREAKCYWRGELDGPWHSPPWSWHTIWRSRLVRLAKEFPDLADIAVVGVDHFTWPGTGNLENEKEIARFEAFAKPYLKRRDPPSVGERYKYVVSVDGVSAAWRVTRLLGSGSTLLMQESPYFEHFYALLKPWVHYVPIRFDLQDLEQKIRWAKAHDAQAKQIAQQAAALAKTSLREEDAQCYLWRALSSLGSLQKGQVLTRRLLNKLEFQPVAGLATRESENDWQD